MSNDKPDVPVGRIGEIGGAHQHGEGLTFEQSLEASRKRNAEYRRQIESGEREEYVYHGRPKRTRKR